MPVETAKEDWVQFSGLVKVVGGFEDMVWGVWILPADMSKR